MPLTLASPGQPMKVVRVGGNEQTHHHLENLGIVADSEVQVVNRVGPNLILMVRDSRIALDGALAVKIMVEETEMGHEAVPQAIG